MTILGTLELDLSAPTGTLAADLRRADEMIRASNKAWAESGKINWGIAASLHTEMRAARSIFNSSLRAMESDAKGYRIEIDLDFGKQIAELNKQKIVPQVDDSQLTALNAHLSLKERHLEQVIGKFNSSKITPQVDDRGLTELNRSLDRVEGNRQISIDIASKSVGGNIAGSIASPLIAVARGAAENFGKALTEPFTKGLSGALERAIGKTLGSSQLVGEKIGDAIAADLKARIGKTLGIEIDRVAEDFLGRENIDREYGANKSRSNALNRNKSQKSAEQLNLDRQELARENYKDLAKLEEIKDTKSRVDRVRSIVKSKSDKAQENLYETKLNDSSPLRLSRVERVASGRNRQLAELDELSANLESERAGLEGKVEKNKARRLQLNEGIDRLSPEPVSAYRDLAELAAGKKLKPDAIPEVIVADKLLDRIGGNAAYNEEANIMLVRSELDRQAREGKLTGKNMSTLFHESVHAADYGHGSIDGIRAGKNGEILSNRNFTSEEVDFASPYIEKYTPAQQTGELSAYAMQFRNRELFTNQDRKLALAEFQKPENYGVAGKRYKSFSSQSLESQKSDLQSLVGLIPSSEIQELISIRKELKLKTEKIIQSVNKSVGSGKLIDGLEESIAENIGEFEAFGELLQRYKVPVPQEIGDPWGDAVKNVASKAGQGAGNLARSTGNQLDRVATSGINRVLSKNIDPNTIDLNPRQISSVRDLTRGDLLQAARLGTYQVASAAAPVYGALRGVEHAALNVLPFGHEIKSLTQKTILPAAGFAAASQMPILGPAMSGGINAIVGGGLDFAAGGIANAVGSQFANVPLIGGAIQSALTGTAGLGAELATPIVASILGGKSLMGMAQTGTKLLLPQQVTNNRPELELVAQQITQQKLEMAAEVTQQHLNSVRQFAEQFSLESINSPRLLGSSKSKALPAAPDISEIVPDIDWANKVKANAKKSYKSLKDAIKSGNEEMAKEIAMGFDLHGDKFIAQIKKYKDATPAGKLKGEFNDVQTYLSRTQNLAREYLAKQDDLGLRRQIDLDSIPDPWDDLNNKPTRSPQTLGRAIAPPLNPPPPPSRRTGIGSRFLPESDGMLGIPGLGKIERQIDNDELYRVSPAARRFDRTYDRANKNIDREMSQSAQGIEKELDRIGKNEPAISKSKTAMEKLTGVGKLALGTFAGYTLLSLGVPAMISLGKATLDTASSFEQLQLKLQASTGSLAAGKQRFAEVRNEARSLGISQQGALETASRISATTFGTELEGLPSDIFTSQINQISQARGLSGQQQGSLSLALSQIIGKPRVSAEEINQLVESGGMPDARTIAARSMGYTPQQFTKMMESGTGIDPKRFVSAFLSQATSDSLLVKDAALDTQQAKLNSLNSSIEDLQATIGGGVSPAFNAGLDLLAGSVNFLNEGIERGSKILTGAATFAIAAVTWSLIEMSVAAYKSGMAASLMGAGWNTFLAIGPQLLKVAGYAALFTVLGETISQLGKEFSNTSADIEEGANKIAIAFGKVNDKGADLSLPKTAKDVQAKDGNWFEGLILGGQRNINWMSERQSELGDAIVKNDFSRNLRKTLGIDVPEPMAKPVIKLTDSKEKEEFDRVVAVDNLGTQSQAGIKKTLAAIEKAKSLTQIDLDLNTLSTQRSGLFANSQPDTAKLADLDARYKSKYLERINITQGDKNKGLRGLADDQAAAEENINQLKTARDKLNAEIAKGPKSQVSQESYDREIKIIETSLKDAESAQKKLNAAIKSGLDDLTPWTRQLDRIVAKFDDIRTNAELASSELSIERSLGQINGKYTKGQGEYKRDRDNENSILSQIKEKERTVKELRSFLNIKDPEAVKNVQKAYGVDDKTTAAQLKLTAETATGMDKEILSKMAVLKEQAADITGLYDKFAAARTEAMYRIEAEHREMVQYYVGISRQVDPQDAKYSKLISDIQQNKNKMLMKLGGYSSSMFDGWFSAFFDLLEAPKRKLEAQAQAAREMKAAIERWQDTNLDIDTRARSRYAPVDGGTHGIQQGDRSSSTSPQSPNGQSVPQQGQLAQGMSKWAQQEQGKAGQGGKSGQVVVSGNSNSNDLLQRSTEANDARFRQEQERIVQGLTNTLWDEEVKKYQKETELAKTERESRLQIIKSQRAEQKRQRDLIVPVTVDDKQRKEREDQAWSQEDSAIDMRSTLQKYTDDVGKLYGLRRVLQESKGVNPEDERVRLDSIDKVNTLLTNIAIPALNNWKVLMGDSPKFNAEARKRLEEQQKYDRGLNTEQQEQNQRTLKKSKLEGERSRIAQQMPLRPFNRDLSKRDRELDFEITNLQIESDKVSQLRQITNDKREGKLTSAQADERTKTIKANAQKGKQNAIEKQSQSSQQEANKYDAEERQLVIKSRSEILEQMGLNVRIQTASDKIDSPFANNKGLDLQRLLDLAKIDNEKLVKLNELEEARVKYKDDDQGFLSKAEANYKTAITNLELQKQAIESEYSGSLADRSKERKGYVFNQNQSEYRVFLEGYKAQTDGMKFAGQDTRERDYEYQYNQKQTDYLQRRFDLKQQRDGIKGMSEEAINSRAQIDRVIEGLNKLEATDLSNFGAQFDRLNEVLLQTQKATRDVFGEFAFKGKFDWRKILRAPLESIANQALDKAVPDLFAGLYRKGEPPASAKNNPQQVYTKRATSTPELNSGQAFDRSNAGEYITNSIERPIQSEPVQPSIPAYTKRATSTPEPNTNTSVQLPQPSSSRYVAQPIDPPRDPEPPPMRAEAPQPSTSAYTKRATLIPELILPQPPQPPTKAELDRFGSYSDEPVIDFFNNPDGSIGQKSNESYTKRATSIPVPTIPIPQPPTQSQIIPVDYRAIGTKAPKIPQGLQRLGKQGQLVKLPSAPSVKGEKPIDQSYEAGSDLFGFMNGVRSKNYFSTIASGFNILRGLKLFSNGGKVEPDDRFQQLRSGNNPIAAALQKEGSNSIVAALTPGERVLNLRETRVYESMFPKGIQGYKDGGIAGGLKPVPMNLDRSRIESSSNNNVSFNIDNRGNVEGKGNERGMMKELEHAVTAVMLKHKRGKTGLI